MGDCTHTRVCRALSKKIECRTLISLYSDVIVGFYEPDICSAEIPGNAATSRIIALNVTAGISILHSFLKCKNFL